MLYNEYGVNETNVSKAIPFDVPSLLTAQDKLILYYICINRNLAMKHLLKL